MLVWRSIDIENIRKFTRTTRDVAREFGVDLELLYVGKNTAKKYERKTRITIDIIIKEKLSRTYARLEPYFGSFG